MRNGWSGFLPSVVICLWLVITASLGWTQGQAESLSPEAQDAVPRLDAQDSYTRQHAFLQLEALREPATAPLIRERLSSRDARTRAFSARALAAIQGVTAVPDLLARLKQDRSPEVRVAALLALEPFQDQHPDILPAFLGSLRDRRREVRIAAVDIVSRIDQPEAREAIRTRWRRERDRDVLRVLELAMKRLAEE